MATAATTKTTESAPAEQAPDKAAILARPPKLIPADADVPEGHVVLPLPPTHPSTLKRVMSIEEYEVRLARLADPFAPDQIEKLPRALQKGDQNKGRCEASSDWVSSDGHYCGGWHARSIHLDYVGHAGITMRLVEVDPLYYLDTIAHDQLGQPMWNANGTYASLMILGMTRPGFGDAGDKYGANAIKEVIGDALRNIAMRFGVGTYLWSKSDAAAALKTDQDAPPAVSEDEFWRSVATASLAPDPEKALIAYGQQMTRETLATVTVTLPNHATSNAADALQAAINSARNNGAAHAPAADAPEQDAHAGEPAHAQPDDDAPAPDARAHDEQEPARDDHAHHAPDQVEAARADSAPPTAPTDAPQAAGSMFQFTPVPADEVRQHKQPRMLWDELRYHAHVRGVPEPEYMAGLLGGEGVTKETRPAKLIQAIREGRPAVITALHAQMRSTQAEVLTKAGDAAPINLEAELTEALANA